jgi:hypothetical protein
MGQSNTWTGLPCFLWAQKYPARVRPASREKVTFRQKEKKETRASLGSSSRKGDRDLDKPAPALLRSSTLFSLPNFHPSSLSPCPPPWPARRTATTNTRSTRKREGNSATEETAAKLYISQLTRPLYSPSIARRRASPSRQRPQGHMTNQSIQ